MTRLRRQMLEELERRHYSANTVRTYVRTVEDLARYFKRRPDRLVSPPSRSRNFSYPFWVIWIAGGFAFSSSISPVRKGQIVKGLNS